MTNGTRVLLTLLGGLGILWVVRCLLYRSPENAAGKSVGRPNGKALYTRFCADCHGVDGKNDRAAAVPQMRLTGATRLSMQNIEEIIRNGQGLMPALKSRLGPDEIHAVARYARDLANSSSHASTSGTVLPSHTP